MTYRILQEADVQAYREIRIEGLRTDPQAFGSSLAEFEALTVDRVRETFRPDEGRKFNMGAFDGEVLVGAVNLSRPEDVRFRHRASVAGMYVSTSARGKGIGKGLMLALIEEAKTFDGLEHLALSVIETQEAAMGLYRSLGFEAWGVEPRAIRIDGQYADIAYMTMRI